MKHDFIKTGDADSYRQIEDSNGEVVLSQCRVCKCAEGELTTECAGEEVLYETRQRVYGGEIDFRCGAWRYIK